MRSNYSEIKRVTSNPDTPLFMKFSDNWSTKIIFISSFFFFSPLLYVGLLYFLSLMPHLGLLIPISICRFPISSTQLIEGLPSLRIFSLGLHFTMYDPSGMPQIISSLDLIFWYSAFQNETKHCPLKTLSLFLVHGNIVMPAQDFFIPLDTTFSWLVLPSQWYNVVQVIVFFWRCYLSLPVC